MGVIAAIKLSRRVSGRAVTVATTTSSESLRRPARIHGRIASGEAVRAAVAAPSPSTTSRTPIVRSRSTAVAEGSSPDGIRRIGRGLNVMTTPTAKRNQPMRLAFLVDGATRDIRQPF